MSSNHRGIDRFSNKEEYEETRSFKLSLLKTDSNSNNKKEKLTGDRKHTASDGERSDGGYDDANKAFEELFKLKAVVTIWMGLVEFWRILRPKIASVIVFLVTMFTLMTLFVYSGDEGLYGVAPGIWYRFFFLWSLIYVLATLADNLLFFIVEKLDIVSYDIMSMSKCINGPLGSITAILLYDSWYRHDPVPSAISKWRAIITLVITILVLQALKNFYQIRSYVRTLEDRFSERLSLLESYVVILSRLASYTHPKKAQPVVAGKIPFENMGPKPDKNTYVLTEAAIGEAVYNTATVEGTAEVNEKDLALQKLRNSSLFRKQVVKHNSFVNVFKEIVIASQENIEEEAVQEEIDLLTKQHKTFWVRMAALNTGSIKICTCNGVLLISKRQHAQSFGKKLHTHLTRQSRRRVTEEVICDIIRTVPILRSSDENIDDTVSQAKLLFQGLVNDKGITKEAMISVTEKVHKERVNLVDSIATQKELHDSLVSVANTIFWILMILVAQTFLQIDTTTFLAPLLTIVFGISFALGPIIGNAFLAIGFVLFMLPFDVGDIICIGSDPATRQLGWILSVSLLQTKYRTNLSEVVTIPNHVMFSTRLVNLTRSRNGSIEVPVSFAMHGKDAPGLDKINQFMEGMKKYVFEENTADWKDLFITCHTIDSTINRLGYSLWVTSQHGPGELGKLYGARRFLLEKMYQLQAALDITFVKVLQPVDLISEASIASKSKGVPESSRVPFSQE